MYILFILTNQIYFPENQPYWFDIKGVVTDIWDDIISVKDELANTIKWLKESSSDLAAKRFTGVDLVLLFFVPVFLVKFVITYKSVRNEGLRTKPGLSHILVKLRKLQKRNLLKYLLMLLITEICTFLAIKW